MQYKVQFKPTAIKELKKIDRAAAVQIIAKIEKLQDDLDGDVKKLTNFTPEYRLRVGNYRILFEIMGDNVIIYHIKHRKDAY